jgi:hypothetical protein
MSAVDPVFGDDWMAIADAIGGTAPHPAEQVTHVAHPAYAAEFTNLALELLLAKWEEQLEDLDPDVPIPYFIPTDDAPCEGDCGRTVCHCLTACCEGSVDQGPCDHGLRLCDECREVCRDCQDNLVDDYIDGDER